MTLQRAVKNSLIQNARDVVAGVRDEGYPLTGACIVSSLAAGDFTSASDVDMLLITHNSEGKPGIFRRLISDRVFEWMVLPNDSLKDVDAILADAGLCHDILSAIILLDKDHWLEQVQMEVASQYQAPQWIWKRTMGQIQRVASAIRQMQKQLADGNILLAQRAHVSVLKSLFGIPRAILNRRCTMVRGLLFCRESASELGWSGYLANALTVFGAAKVSEKDVANLQDIAVQIIDATQITETEKAIRRWFLQSSDWLLENAQPAEAVWPLYFWSSTTAEESGGCQNPLTWEHWQRFTAILGISGEQELSWKYEQAQRLYELAVDFVEAYRPQLGL